MGAVTRDFPSSMVAQCWTTPRDMYPRVFFHAHEVMVGSNALRTESRLAGTPTHATQIVIPPSFDFDDGPLLIPPPSKVRPEFTPSLSRTDSACLVFTGYHVKDTKPCYLI